MKKTQRKITNDSNAKALQRARKLCKLTRHDLAQRLNISYKTIEKYENGRAILDREKIQQLLEGLNLTWDQFRKIKKHKGITGKKRVKKVFCNQERRSYKRIISKECRVLKILRKKIKISQDEASRICGYSRATIGHIENGRIELNKERICHIVNSYGFSVDDFNGLIGSSVNTDELLEKCFNILQNLENDKLKVVEALLINLQ